MKEVFRSVTRLHESKSLVTDQTLDRTTDACHRSSSDPGISDAAARPLDGRRRYRMAGTPRVASMRAGDGDSIYNRISGRTQQAEAFILPHGRDTSAIVEV